MVDVLGMNALDGLGMNAASRQQASVRRFVDRVAIQCGAQSALEGPIDGASAERGGHSQHLAARGVAVTVAVQRVADENAVRSLYVAASLKPPDVRCIPEPLAPGALPPADLVVSYDATAHVSDWESYLTALARAARKVLVVIVRNPQRAFGYASHPGRETIGLARLLWAVGRVREHAYLAVPGWVGILQRARGRQSADDVIQSPVGTSVRLSAPLHAFVVDTAPRTPQARRRLGLAASA